VVRACLAAGLYPNLVRVDAGNKRSKFFAQEHGMIKVLVLLVVLLCTA
jgi:hypothetical protein